jgi:hypothetical protein
MPILMTIQIPPKMWTFDESRTVTFWTQKLKCSAWRHIDGSDFTQSTSIWGNSQFPRCTFLSLTFYLIGFFKRWDAVYLLGHSCHVFTILTGWKPSRKRLMPNSDYLIAAILGSVHSSRRSSCPRVANNASPFGPPVSSSRSNRTIWHSLSISALAFRQ